MAFSVVDRLCDKKEGSLCVHGWMVLQSKCCKTKAVGTVMSNRKEVPKEAFSKELKKDEKYHTNGITSWPSSGRTSVISFT
jgi:hypothetical protein